MKSSPKDFLSKRKPMSSAFNTQPDFSRHSDCLQEEAQGHFLISFLPPIKERDLFLWRPTDPGLSITAVITTLTMLTFL